MLPLRLPLLLVPVTALALVLTGPASAAPTSSAPRAAGGPLADDLDGEVARTTDELTAGTARLEQGQARLAQVRAQSAAAQVAATSASLQAADTSRRLHELVGAAYRSPSPGRLALVLAGPENIKDALRADASLEHVQGRQSDVAAQATIDRERAELAVRRAAELGAVAVAQEQDLARQVADLQDKAESARVRVDAAQRAAGAERTAAGARASRDRTAAPPPLVAAAIGPGCGGGSLGGYANGRLPASSLCPLRGTDGLLLRADAADALNRMAAAGGMPCVGNSYRSYSEQVALYRVKPSLAAVPGTSNHGWGVAVDFACGADRFGSAAYQWLKANGPRFGWGHPSWAEPGSNRPEPWHWEFTG